MKTFLRNIFLPAVLTLAALQLVGREKAYTLEPSSILQDSIRYPNIVLDNNGPCDVQFFVYTSDPNNPELSPVLAPNTSLTVQGPFDSITEACVVPTVCTPLFGLACHSIGVYGLPAPYSEISVAANHITVE